MTIQMTKIWFDGENIGTQEIPEQALYKDDLFWTHWCALPKKLV